MYHQKQAEKKSLVGIFGDNGYLLVTDIGHCYRFFLCNVEGVGGFVNFYFALNYGISFPLDNVVAYIILLAGHQNFRNAFTAASRNK